MTMDYEPLGRVEVRPVPVTAHETYEDRVAAFIGLQEDIAAAIWKQGAIVAEVERVHGKSSVEVFARDVGVSASWAWKLAKLHSAFGGAPVSPDLPPTTHIVIAEKTGCDPEKARKWAEEAADSGWSRRRTAYEMDVRRIPEEDLRDPVIREPRTARSAHTCPLCDGRGEVDAETFGRFREVWE